MRQEQGEPVNDFISRLRNLAAKCQFRDNTEVEDRVLDQLIWGSKNPEVQKSLIGRDKSLTLAGATEIARSHEATSKHMKTLVGSSESHQGDRSVDAIQPTVTTAENNTRGTNVQLTVQYVKNAAKLIIGNLSADPSNGNNSTKEESQPSKNLFIRLRTGEIRKTMMKFSQSVQSRLTS